MPGRIFGPDDLRAATGVSRETADRLAAHVDLLRRWQARINLVAKSTLDDIWHRHVFDSLQLVGHLPPDATRIVDLGSGAGFPGLVLAAATGCHVDLIESDQRKCAFLRESARVMGLEVGVHAARIENLTPWRADVATARALAPLAKLVAYAAPFIGESGADAGENSGTCLFLKSQDIGDELTEATKCWSMEAEIVPSASDQRGAIVKVGYVRRRHPHRAPAGAEPGSPTDP